MLTPSRMLNPHSHMPQTPPTHQRIHPKPSLDTRRPPLPPQASPPPLNPWNATPLPPLPQVFIHAEEHGEGHKEVDGIEEGADSVHAALVHKGVVRELQGQQQGQG